jgi:uridine kinase
VSAGGTASGKTTVCEEMVRHLGGRVALIQMDRFYKTLPHSKPANTHNFDEPDAFDWPLFIETLQKLSTGQAVQVPQYSFDTHMRLPKVDTVSGADVILVESVAQ